MGREGPQGRCKGFYRDNDSGKHLNASVDQVVLMDRAASGEDIAALYQEKKVSVVIDNETKAQQDADRIAVPATAYDNITLPLAGTRNGSTITWESSHPEVTGTDGTVRVPEEGAVSVTLTATVTCGDGSEAKTVKK